MKKDIHPKYNEEIVITCACGATFHAGSTKDEISTELCSQCHPFYTGKHKLVDTAGRVDRFQAKLKKASEAQTKAEQRKAAQAAYYAKLQEEKEVIKKDAKAAGQAKKAVKKAAAVKPSKAAKPAKDSKKPAKKAAKKK